MSAEDSKLLQCYNRSCGQMFDPATNTEESCLHHPGVPVFHDAYKKWSCCDRKTTDFTEFLNFKGCTKSYHSNVKPPEPEKPVKPKIEEVPCIPKPLEQQKFMVRPDINEPMERLAFKIGSSLKPLLDNLLKEITNNDEAVNDGIIQIDTPCHNKGCKAVYKGENSNNETCIYHSGVPIFHEGMKYWSCCVKRTTDFDSFLEQVGCATGKHKWHKEKDTENKTKCRYDWHQTPGSVVVSIFSKCPIPELSYVEANPVKLRIHITFGKGKDVFDEEINLFGIANIKNSCVTYLGSKVEINLKKAEPMAWKDLRLRLSLPQINDISLDEKDDLSLDVK